MISKTPKQFFDQHTQLYLRLAKWASSEQLLAASLLMLQRFRAGCVVDLGSGDGLLLRHLGDSLQRVAIDISVNMLNAIPGQAVQKIVADVHKIPLIDQSVHLAICRQILHYVEAPTVLREAYRILKKNGYLHIVQLTDYEGVPDAWYEYWASLRGIVGRTHLSRSRLLQYTQEQGYSVVEEENCEMVAQDLPWREFFEKNHVPENREQEVREFFVNASPQIKQIHRIHTNDRGLSYVRRFSLFLLSPRGTTR